MTGQQAARFLNVSPDQIRGALLDPRALPEWNPAFRSIGGPEPTAIGTIYPITAIGGLTGTWEYTRIEDESIDMTWQVPGFRETGTWQMRAHMGGTVVTHSFSHEGPLARMLSHAYRGVAELRLDRLAGRVKTTSLPVSAFS